MVELPVKVSSYTYGWHETKTKVTYILALWILRTYIHSEAPGGHEMNSIFPYIFILLGKQGVTGSLVESQSTSR